MALQPRDRYPSARDLALDVERYLADDKVDAYEEPLGVRAGAGFATTGRLCSV